MGAITWLALLGSPREAEAQIELIISEPSPGVERQLTTFEGAVEGILVGYIGIMDFTVAANAWVAISGLPGTPSGEISALLADAPARDVRFDTPVFAVNFYYASVPPILVHAFDHDGRVISSACAPGNIDPNTFAFSWAPVSLSVSQNSILRVRVAGGESETVIDNFACKRIVDNTTGIGGSGDTDPIHQQPTKEIEWIRQFGGTGPAQDSASAIDAAGNV